MRLRGLGKRRTLITLVGANCQYMWRFADGISVKSSPVSSQGELSPYGAVSKLLGIPLSAARVYWQSLRVLVLV